ncbi:hypothetical protein [Thermogutta sp.]|uniref:hypothetical protein n=1 Tax=Thermogutta sp. TaxID=1962930 RepID=UPI00321FBCB0
MNSDTILAKIEASLDDPETPRWAIPMLLCIRDDHRRLNEHLATHNRWSVSATQILINVIIAISVAVTFWFLAGRLPAIFGP